MAAQRRWRCGGARRRLSAGLECNHDMLHAMQSGEDRGIEPHSKPPAQPPAPDQRGVALARHVPTACASSPPCPPNTRTPTPATAAPFVLTHTHTHRQRLHVVPVLQRVAPLPHDQYTCTCCPLCINPHPHPPPAPARRACAPACRWPPRPRTRPTCAACGPTNRTQAGCLQGENVATEGVATSRIAGLYRWGWGCLMWATLLCMPQTAGVPGCQKGAPPRQTCHYIGREYRTSIVCYISHLLLG